MLGIGQLLLDHVANMPQRIAVASETAALTYGELNRQCNCVANGMRSQGIGKGTRVAVLLRNGLEWITAWYACQKIGAVFVPLHIRAIAREIMEFLEISDSAALIYGTEFSGVVQKIKSEARKLRLYIAVGADEAAGDLCWDSFFEQPDEREAQVELGNSDPSLILFTSGTTGRPKGVLRTQETAALHGITLAVRNNHFNHADTMMSTAPLYHVGGLQALLKMLVLGGTFLTLDGIKASEIIRLIQKYQVTQLQILPPVSYERLYYSGQWKSADLSSVWEVCISAGKCTKEYTDHIFEMFPNCHLRPSWGSTEACSVTCMQLTKEALCDDPGLINAIGYPLPLTSVRILDSAGHDVKPGQSGEAIVKSPMLFSGYLRCEGESASHVFTKDGWYYMGDIVRKDPETGCYFFLDRKKDVIKTGGENVYALEVERVIQELPAVLECAVVGVPDPRFGEGIAAAIVLKDGYRLTKEELIGFCRKKLSSYKKPRYWAIVDHLPVNSAGKVCKSVLRERWKEWAEPIC